MPGERNPHLRGEEGKRPSPASKAADQRLFRVWLACEGARSVIAGPRAK